MCELWKGFQEGPNSIEQSWQSNKFRWIILQIIISSSFCCPTPTLHSIHSEHPLAFIWYIELGIPRCTKMAHWFISVIQGLFKVKFFKTSEKIVILLCLTPTLCSIHSEHPFAFIWHNEQGIPRCMSWMHTAPFQWYEDCQKWNYLSFEKYTNLV